MPMPGQAPAAPPSAGTPPRIIPVPDLIRQAAKQQGVPEALALAFAEQESSFNPTAIGKKIRTRAGEEQAVGTFQILPSTWASEQLGTDINDPMQNITGGVKYIRKLLDQSQGDLDKALAIYGGVINDTAYVPAMQTRIQKFMGAAPGDTAGAMAPPPALPAAATAGMLPPSTTSDTLLPPPTPPPGASPSLRARFDRLYQRGALGVGADIVAGSASSTGRLLAETGRAGIVEPVVGLAELVGTAYDKGVLETGKQMGSAILTPTRQHLAQATTARREGDPLAWASHMVSAIPIYGPIIEQVSEQIGSGDVYGGVGRAIGSIVPIRGLRRTPGAKAVAAPLQRSATASMGKLLRAAGDGSPEAAKAVEKVLPLAMDRAILRATRGGMVEAIERGKETTGAQVGAALSRVSSEIVSTTPIVESLSELRKVAENYVPVGPRGEAIGAAASVARGITDLKAVPFQHRLIAQISRLEEVIANHGPTIFVGNLVNMRRGWDDIVYAGQSWLNKQKLKVRFEARAKSAAADSIRRIISQDPALIDLAAVDKAFHLHNQLWSFVADEAFGKGHGMVTYYPGFGAGAAVTRRVLNAATKSPTWRLLPITAKSRLAQMIVEGNDSGIRAFARQVIAGSIAGVGRGDTAHQENDLLSMPPAPVEAPAAIRNQPQP